MVSIITMISRVILVISNDSLNQPVISRKEAMVSNLSNQMILTLNKMSTTLRMLKREKKTKTENKMILDL